ncbi:DNA-binding protein [Chitinophaga silvatica]|uniref:DNA-binding protein n=1 Tax=Chitinophaga silvatica TaxID=2282649 RepID=A0A3E1YHJ6_9BACT|nr:helix-turn-helix domain-containing protein [Chitinophaga silvatica]RFS26804.1 DNA-binding protein [Chitinophaga silvatica]
MSTIEVLTKEDLFIFKKELLQELEAMFARNKQEEPKRWLKTYEVKKMLGLSSGTLQTMRNKGTLKFSMIGNLAYYDYNEIVALMEKKKLK